MAMVIIMALLINTAMIYCWVPIVESLETTLDALNDCSATVQQVN